METEDLNDVEDKLYMVTEWSLECTCYSVEWMELKGDWMAPFSFHGMVAFCLVSYNLLYDIAWISPQASKTKEKKINKNWCTQTSE